MSPSAFATGAHGERGIALRGSLQRQADAHIVGAVTLGKAPGATGSILLPIHGLAQPLVGDLLALRVIDAERGLGLKAKELVEGGPVERDLQRELDGLGHAAWAAG